VRLLSNLLRRFIRHGTLRVRDADGKVHVFGGRLPGPDVAIHLHDRKLYTRLFINPELYAAEAYMDGTLTLVRAPPSCWVAVSVSWSTPPAVGSATDAEQSGIGACDVSVPPVRHAELAEASGPGGVTHEVGEFTFALVKGSEMTSVSAAPAGEPTATAARLPISGARAMAPTNSTRLTRRPASRPALRRTPLDRFARTAPPRVLDMCPLPSCSPACTKEQ